MFLAYIIIFIFGLCIGSFLNCLIYRLEVRKSAFRGRSFCPKCKHQLAWQDLIPLASFVFLGGKCRYCKKTISIQYPLVELFSGIIFVLIFWYLDFGFGLPAPYRTSGASSGAGVFGFLIFDLLCFWVISSCLVIIFVFDLKHYLIPDSVVFPAIGLASAFRLYELIFKAQSSHFIIYTFLSALAASLFFFLIWAISRRKWLGFGDVKLVFLLGLFAGWPNILPALFLSFLIGAIIGLILMVLGKKGMKSEVPFGPFLITGAFLGLFWGKQLISWYLNLVI